MAISPMLKSLDYIFVLRPILFIPGWSTLLAGYLITRKDEFFFTPDVFIHLNYAEIVILLVIFSAAMGASFLLNQLMDIETDLKNKKLFILSENQITQKSAIIETSLLILLALVLSMQTTMGITIAVACFLIITGYFYNFKPFSLKDKPLGSVFANVLMGWLAFAMGWLAVHPYSYLVFIDSLPYVFFNTALYFFTLLPDIPGDKKSLKRTLAVLYGANFIIFLAELFYIASFLSALILQDYFSLIFIACSLPFFLLVIVKRNVNMTIKTTKYAILFFAFALWLKIPFYFLLLVAIFILTKWYFKRRFGYSYPNFKGE